MREDTNAINIILGRNTSEYNLNINSRKKNKAWIGNLT